MVRISLYKCIKLSNNNKSRTITKSDIISGTSGKCLYK